MANDSRGPSQPADGRRGRTRRRDPGDGAVYQRGSDGRWIGRLKLPGDGHRYFTGTTQKSVRARLKVAQRAVDEGRLIPNERLTFGAYLERWLAGLPATDLKPSTVDYYRRYVANHVSGSMPARKQLGRLTPDDLKQLYASKLDAGLSKTTVHHLHAVIHRALSAAYRHDEVARNVAGLLDKKEKPGLGRPRLRVLTDDQPERFLAAIRGERLEALFVVAVTAGLRQGELLALRWNDVDLDSGELAVTGSLQGSRRSNRHVAVPKSGHGRRVALASIAVTALRAHGTRQLEERLFAGSKWVEDGLVFCNTVGGYLNPATLNHTLDRVLRRAELPHIRFHDLRHTAATRMLRAKQHPKIVSEMLGHSSVSVTLDLYSHVTPTMQRDAVDAAWG